jgi:hypothetical protein
MCRHNIPAVWRVSHIPLPGTPREARAVLALPFSREAAARPNSVVADAPINHSSDHSVRATLGRQGRPRRPVLTFDIPGRCDRHPLSAPTSEQWCILNVALIESPFPASALTPRPRKVTVDLDHMARKALQHYAGSE